MRKALALLVLPFAVLWLICVIIIGLLCMAWQVVIELPCFLGRHRPGLNPSECRRCGQNLGKPNLPKPSTTWR